MTVTYEKIATNTTTGTVTSVTFSSIPATYTDLVIVMTGIRSAAGGTDVYVRCNGDTGNNYGWLAGSGSNASVTRGSNAPSNGMLTDSYGWVTDGSNNITIFNIFNYANTNVYKMGYSRANNANSKGVDMISTVWASTAAINSLTAFCDGFAAGSIITIYGIKAE